MYLFLGTEAYHKQLCRKALIEKVLPPEEREQGYVRLDLEETSLRDVLDDARSFSLFAGSRLIWVAGAEGALPRRMTGGEQEEADVAALAAYVRNPTPGTVVVFEASRFDFEGEDKPKLERVQKFYAPVRDQVEFQPFTPDAARRLAQDLSRESGLQISSADIGLLVDALAANACRIASEVEKLRLYAGPSGKITTEDILQLVPDAQASTIFSLVNALGRGDRTRAMESLDALLRQGEYLPLALTFLATQFRLALAAQEAEARNGAQIEQQFRRQGIRIWRERAEQLAQTASVFSGEKLRKAIDRVYRADKALRDVRPDDRVVMEELVLSLT